MKRRKRRNKQLRVMFRGRLVTKKGLRKAWRKAHKKWRKRSRGLPPWEKLFRRERKFHGRTPIGALAHSVRRSKRSRHKVRKHRAKMHNPRRRKCLTAYQRFTKGYFRKHPTKGKSLRERRAAMRAAGRAWRKHRGR